MTLRLLTTAFAIVLFAQAPIVNAKISSEPNAISMLMQRVNKSQVYAPWLKPGCSAVITEAKTAQFFEFSLRENHTGNCKGDPNTSHVIDRFRVSRINNAILWYDVVSDEYLPFKALIENRKSKK